MARQIQVDLPGEVDALLRQALSAEPSVEFLPRVRKRVAEERPRTFPFWTTTSLAGAAAAVVLLVALWPEPPAGPLVVRVAPPVASVQRPAAPPVRPQVQAMPSPGRLPRVAAPKRTAEPEVIVDRRQRAAIASVMRLAAEGKLTTDSFAQTSPPSLQAIREQVTPLSVPAVRVSPIAVGGVLQMGTDK